MGKEDYYLASDVPAFLKFTNAVHFLLDGEAVILTKAGVSLHDVETHAKKKFGHSTY